MSKVLVLLLLFISLTSFVIAACPEVPSDCPVESAPVEYPEYSDFSDYQTWDSSQQAAYLTDNYDVDHALVFYQGGGNIGTNPDVDARYFYDFSNYAQNPESFDQFFTGSYDGATPQSVRENFVNNPSSASQYLSERFGATYSIATTGEGDNIVGTLADNFAFSPAEGEDGEDGYIPASLTNGGAHIFLDDYSDDTSIQEIRAVGDGIEIVRLDKFEVEQTITINGDALAGQQVSYNSESREIVLTNRDGTHRTFTLDEGENVGNVQFNIDSVGVLRVTGKVSTVSKVGRIQNFRGTLAIYPNGDITAENAEIITSDIYASGQFEIRGNTITAYNHGDTEFGNINNDGKTVIIDRATGVGVTTQGQNKADGTKVIITRDTISDNSIFFSEPSDSSSEPGSEGGVPADLIGGLRARAAELAASPRTDLAGNAEVFIKQDPVDGTVIVSAFGKVDVAFYAHGATGGAAPFLRTPHFTGTDDSAAFDMQITGLGAVLNVRGKADYTDDQYFQQGEGQGISTSQKTASVLISRGKESLQDVVYVDCSGCVAGEEVVNIHKPVRFVQSTSVSDVYSQNLIDLDLTITATEEGLSYSDTLSSLGDVAQAQSESGRVAIGRDIIIQVPCGQDKSCNFEIGTDADTGQVHGSYESYDSAAAVVISKLNIDLGMPEQIGAATIFVDEKTAQELDRFILIVQSGKFEELSSIHIEPVPGLRELMLSETGLDITLLDNTEYLSHLGRIVESRQRAEGFIEQIRAKGIDVDDQGRPRTDEAREKLERSMRSFDDVYWWNTAVQINLARVERDQARALRASCTDGTECVISDAQLKQIERDTSQRITSLQTERDAANTRAEKKQEIRNRERTPAEVATRSLIIFQHEQLQERSARLAQAQSRLQGTQSDLQALREQRDRMKAEGKDWTSPTKYLDIIHEIEFYEGAVRTQQESVDAEQMQVDSSLGMMQGNILVHSDDPEFAAELAMTAGMYELGEQFLDEVEELTPELSGEIRSTARLAQIETLLDEGRLSEASAIHQELASSDNPKSRLAAQEAQGLLDVAGLQSSLDNIYDAQQRELDAQLKTNEETSGFFGFLDHASRSGFLNPVSWFQTAAGIVEYVIPGGDDGSERYTVQESFDLLDEQRDEQLHRSTQIAQATHLALERQVERGIPFVEALRSITSGNIDRSLFTEEENEQLNLIEDRSPFLDVLETQVSGEEVTDEQLARVWEREIREDIVLHEGRTAFVEDQLEALRVTYPDTPSSDWAGAEDVALDQIAPGTFLNERIIQKYGDAALSAVTVFDIVPVQAIGSVLRIGATVAKSTTVGTRVATTTVRIGTKAKTVVYGSRVSTGTKTALRSARLEAIAARASGNTKRIADAAEELVKFERVASSEIDISRRASAVSTGLSLSTDANVLGRQTKSARTALREAIDLGDQAGIDRAVVHLDEAETAERGLSLGGSRAGTWWGETALGKQRGLTSAERAAYEELRLARRAYQTERKAEGVLDIDLLGTSTISRLTTASQAVDKATLGARLTDDIVERLTPAKKADDVAQAASSAAAGSREDLVRKMRELEERGAVLGADSDGAKYLAFHEDDVAKVREIEAALNGEHSAFFDAAYESARAQIVVDAANADTALGAAQRVKADARVPKPGSISDDALRETSMPKVGKADSPPASRKPQKVQDSIDVDAIEGIPTQDAIEDVVRSSGSVTPSHEELLQQREELVHLVETGRATAKQKADVRAIDYVLLHDSGLKQGPIYVGQDTMDAFVNSLLRNGPKEDMRRVFRLEDGSYGVVIQRADGTTTVGNIRFEGELDDILRADVEKAIDNILQNSPSSLDDIGKEIIDEVHLISMEVDVGVGFSDTISTGLHEELRLRTLLGEKDGASILFDAASQGAATPGVSITKIDDISSIHAPGSPPTSTDNLLVDFVAADGKLSRDRLHSRLRNKPTSIQERIEDATGAPSKIKQKRVVEQARKVEEEFEEVLGASRVADDVPTSSVDGRADNIIVVDAPIGDIDSFSYSAMKGKPTNKRIIHNPIKNKDGEIIGIRDMIDGKSYVSAQAVNDPVLRLIDDVVPSSVVDDVVPSGSIDDVGRSANGVPSSSVSDDVFLVPPQATKVGDSIVGDVEVWKLADKEFVAHPQNGWTPRGVSDAMAGCAACAIPLENIDEIAVLEAAQIGVPIHPGSNPPTGTANKIDDAVQEQIKRSFIKDRQRTLKAVDPSVLSEMGLDVRRAVNDAPVRSIDDVVDGSRAANDVPAPSLADDNALFSEFFDRVEVRSSQPTTYDDIVELVEINEKSDVVRYTLLDGTRYVYSVDKGIYLKTVDKEPPQGIIDRLVRIFTSKTEDVPLSTAAQRETLSLNEILLVESARLDIPISSVDDISKINDEVIDIIRESYKVDPDITRELVNQKLLEDMSLSSTTDPIVFDVVDDVIDSSRFSRDEIKIVKSKIEKSEPVKGTFDELLWTHNAPVESLDAIFGSGNIRAIDAQGNVLKRGANFRYGLDSEFGEIKFVMKKDFELGYKGVDKKKQIVDEAYFDDFFGKAKKKYGDDLTDEQIKQKIAQDYEFRNHLPEIEKETAFLATDPSFERSYLNPQLQIGENVDLDGVKAVLVPEHLYDEVVRVAQQNGFDTSKIVKVSGTGDESTYYAYHKNKGLGDPAIAMQQGVRRPNLVPSPTGDGFISGSSSDISIAPNAFKQEEKAYLNLLVDEVFDAKDVQRVADDKIPKSVLDDLVTATKEDKLLSLSDEISPNLVGQSKTTKQLDILKDGEILVLDQGSSGIEFAVIIEGPNGLHLRFIDDTGRFDLEVKIVTSEEVFDSGLTISIDEIFEYGKRTGKKTDLIDYRSSKIRIDEYFKLEEEIKLIDEPFDLQKQVKQEIGSVIADLRAEGSADNIKDLYDDPEIKNLIEQKGLDTIEGLFAADAGVSQGYTIEEHTQLVLDVYAEQRGFYNLDAFSVADDVDLDQLMPVVLSLHDIGKPIAIAKGNKHLQHDFTLPILENKLRVLGYSENEIKIAKNLVSHDVLGELATNQISVVDAYSQLQKLAGDAGMSVSDFYTLQHLFYSSDASSYPILLKRAFNKNTAGYYAGYVSPKNPQFKTLKNYIEIEEVIDSVSFAPDLQSVANDVAKKNPLVTEVLGSSNPTRSSVLGPTSSARELGNIPTLREGFVPDDFFQKNTVAGALDVIREGQSADFSSDIAVVYSQIRSSRPQTFSKQTLDEIVNNIDELSTNDFIHATNSRTLANIRNTAQRAGGPKLLPHGALQESNLAAGTGELGAGTIGSNVGGLSGIDFASGNVDTTYHYARLRGGYDLQEQIRAHDNLLDKVIAANTQEYAEGLDRYLETPLQQVLYSDYEIFDRRILQDDAVQVAGSSLGRDKQFVQQFESMNREELEFVQEGFPILVSVNSQSRKVRFNTNPNNINGEALLNGGIDFRESDVVVFVERENIENVRNYLVSVGVQDPKVSSIESYDVLTAVTESYTHVLDDGTTLTGEALRNRLATDASFRSQFADDIRSYSEVLATP